jgi:hypothetical protein
VAEGDRHHVAFAVGGDDGFVGFTGLAAAMFDGRHSWQIARERLDHRVEVLDLKVLDRNREHHWHSGRVVGVVLRSHGTSCGTCNSGCLDNSPKALSR